MVLQEGRLRIDLPPNVAGWKFDNELHGLSHTMKAVDFIVRCDDNVVWFIEIKDPNQTRDNSDTAERFLHDLKSNRLDTDLVRKYRDSWLYMWACEQVDESIESRYYVIVVSDRLDSALLERRTVALQRRLPLEGPRGRWRRRFAVDCGVFNVESWNRQFTNYPIAIQ